MAGHFKYPSSTIRLLLLQPTLHPKATVEGHIKLNFIKQ